MGDDAKLNPQIATTWIGVKELEEVTIYPLSIPDQIEMSDIVTKAINGFFSSDTGSDVAFVTFMVELIKENIGRVLQLVTCETEAKAKKLLGKVTNTQAAEIAKIVFDVNYKDVLKNVKSLFETVATILPSERPLPPSASATPSTDLKTFTGEPSEKVD